ncbi:uncharacterized protein LOC6559995 [Drosophila grimshawi]|uniref:GH21170 n=1 Tax=Drosophila grimshawi TaxID=7222 RepID=B4J6Q2_DROGR|nr:uncharacterized protein LOC6559995 [Drosophila grimshawi]EDW00955.1 GH21170 [Drosophila grimshawi]
MAHRIKLRCDDFDVIGAVPRDLSVIKNFLKRDCAVKHLIDIEEDFLRKCAQQQEQQQHSANDDTIRHANNKKKQQNGAKEAEQPPPPDPCASTTPPDANAPNYCDPCRRLKTSLVLEELTRPAITNPVYNMGSPPYFDEETVLDSSQPIRFRFRRKANNCDAERTSKLPCTPTENTNVMVLTNSNDIMVWPSQKVSQMNRVPVTLLSGPGDLTEYMLEEETIM